MARLARMESQVMTTLYELWDLGKYSVGGTHRLLIMHPSVPWVWNTRKMKGL